MSVVAPERRDLSKWRRSPDGSGPQEVWEISAPPSNSLFWSLMCSYLIKSSASGDFGANIEHVIGTSQEFSTILAKKNIPEKPDLGRIEERVKNINPFKNAHTLYYDKDLSVLMRVFKLRLNQLANELKKKGKIYDENLKIQAASNAFCCQIDLYNEESGNNQIKTFLPEPFNANSNQYSTLIIFKYKILNAENSLYKMGFEKDYSQNLRVKAVKHILPIANVPSQHIQTILNDVPKDQFLHHLLVQSSMKETILRLYESLYVLKKLSDAGYDVDPLSIGPDGFSAFYHCIRLNDWELLFSLYNYVTKIISLEPQATVLDRLRDVKRQLDKDCVKSQNFSLLSPKQKEAQLMFSQIQLIIKFQCELFENIMSITNYCNYQDGQKQNLTIDIILSKYDEYFYVNNPRSDNQYDQFLDYVRYYNYHNYIDDFTFILFFDNFLSLEIPENDCNRSLVTNSLIHLLEYLISKKIFKKNYYIEEAIGNDKDQEKEVFVPFCYRMKLRKTLSTFRSILNGTPSDKNISPTYVLINCLKKHPMLEEEFQVSRFKEYLEIGGSVSFENSNASSPFVIERTLQVIGEIFRTILDDSVVIPLIKYSFPPNLAEVLCDVRNKCLSHLHIGYAQGRRELEKNEELKKIKEELNKIAERLEAIFKLQTLRVKGHMIDYAMTESRVFPDHIKDNLDIIKHDDSMFKRNFNEKHKDMYVGIAYKIISSLSNTIQNFDTCKMKEVRRDFISLQFLSTSISEYCNTHHSDKFNNTLGLIDLLIDEQNKTCNIDDQKKFLLNNFLSLKQNFEGLLKNISNSAYEIDLPSMTNLFSTIEKHTFFTNEEKKTIEKNLKGFFETHEKAKQQLMDHANKLVSLPDDEIKLLSKDIIATEKTKRDIKANLCNLDKVLPLFQKVDLGNFFKKDEDFFTDFVRILSDDKFRDIILNLCLPQSLHSKISNLRNQKFEFFKERIILLERILIEENAHISNLRKYGTSPACKDHVKRLLRLRFIEEKYTKAALETLLLDCLEYVNKRKGFEGLFTKTSSFFSGFNLRNLLSHGCPIFETANDNLRANNLPTEFIDTIMKLIDDQEGLTALTQLLKKIEDPKISKLKNIILAASQDEYSSLRDIIKKCDNWESYLRLLPIQY